ncbi:MAG: hypothetical protein WCO56_07510 [Verrucomicrobiota bacterium]
MNGLARIVFGCFAQAREGVPGALQRGCNAWGARLVWLVLAGGLMGVAGCSLLGPSRLSRPIGPDWGIRQGQAVWHIGRDKPELAGEVLLATNAEGTAYVEFSKPMMTMMSAFREGEGWHVEFPPNRQSWSGRGTPPVRLLWLHLPAALASRPLPAPLRFAAGTNGTWRLENPAIGELIEGYLLP